MFLGLFSKGVFVNKSDKDIIQALIDDWNAGSIEGRNALLTFIFPVIERLAAMEFSIAPGANTPIVMFDEDEIVQTVSDIFIRKHKFITFDSHEHILSYIKITIFNVLVNHAKSATVKKRDSGDAVLDEDESYVMDDQEAGFLLLAQITETFEKQYPKQAMAFNFKNVLGLSDDVIADILEISQRTLSRYLKFAQVSILNEWSKNQGGFHD